MKKVFLFIVITASLLLGCSADNQASDGETAPDPTVHTDRDGVIAFIGDIFNEPDDATDFMYSYDDSGVGKTAAMGYSLGGGIWDVRYSTGVYFHQDYEPQMDDNMYTSENNFGMDKECEWKGLVVNPRCYYIEYDNNNQDNMYYILVDWYFEDTEELYSIIYFGSEPVKIEPEKVFNY